MTEYSDHAERPTALLGLSPVVETGYGPVYLRLNVDAPDGTPKEELYDHDLFEVFVTIGKSGGHYSAQSEGLAKTISNALRSGTDPRIIAEDLAGIDAGRYAVDHGDLVRSIEDAVGLAMLRFLEGDMEAPIRGDADQVDSINDYGPAEPL